MIYPTRRAVVLIAAGAPAALLVGVLVSPGWLVGPAWVIALIALVVLDARSAGPRSGLVVERPDPPRAAIGRPDEVRIDLRFRDGGPVPSRLEAILSATARLGLSGSPVTASLEGRSAGLLFPFRPVRRGAARLEDLWVRWRGPMGLVWKQTTFRLDCPTPVLTDLRWVRDQAVRLFARDAQFGARLQLDIGEGAEFQALRDYNAGMDRRTIDWKQSARHSALLAKEFRTERNHNVIMALDCGRAACEPVAGFPRVDRFIHAALLLSYACLKSGDRAGLFAFDSHPRLNTGAVAGAGAFRTLQTAAARIDYSTHETNYTLALAALSGGLRRRSLIVVFTDFTDPVAAELMLESMGRLLKRHLVLFVVLRDRELEEMTEMPPETPEDVSRAVVAGGLLREREAVLTRLRRLGAHIVDAPAATVGPEVVEAYLNLKRRDLL